MVTEDPRRYNVGARKIPTERRDVAHAVLTPEDDRGYLDVMGADGEDGVELDGEMVATYSVLLTDTEAETFRAHDAPPLAAPGRVGGASTGSPVPS